MRRSRLRESIILGFPKLGVKPRYVPDRRRSWKIGIPWFFALQRILSSRWLVARAPERTSGPGLGSAGILDREADNTCMRPDAQRLCACASVKSGQSRQFSQTSSSATLGVHRVSAPGRVSLLPPPVNSPCDAGTAAQLSMLPLGPRLKAHRTEAPARR